MAKDVLSTLVPLSTLTRFDREVSPIFCDHICGHAGTTFTHAYVSQRRICILCSAAPDVG